MIQAGAEFTVDRAFRFELCLARQHDRDPQATPFDALGLVAKGYH